MRQAIDERRAVAVVGAAGIGKTTLARAAINETGRGLRLSGAVDFLQSRPFLSLSRVLGRLPAPGDSAAVAAEVQAAVGDDVLLLDDLQWSDADTIEVLPALALAIPLVVTIRPGSDTARRAIKQIDIVGDVIDLEPLDETAALALVQSVLGDRASDLSDLIAGAGGNPLALRALAEAKANDQLARAETLRAVIEDCPHDARHALARLGLHDLEVDGETAGIGDLVERRLAEITPDGIVVAAADLFTELALESLPDDERVALHRRLAATVSDPGEAARHWFASGDLAQAHEAALAAAAIAATPGARAQLLTVAAETAPDDVRWSVTRDAVQALLDLGRLDATRALVARVAHDEPPTRADAIDREVMRARLALDEQRFARVLELANATLDAFDDMAPNQRVGLLVHRAAAKAQLWDLSGAVHDAREAERIGELAGQSTTHARLVRAALGLLNGNEHAQADLTDVLDGALARDEHTQAKEAARLLALACFFDGDRAGGSSACDRLAQLAAHVNNLSWDREARALKAVNLSLADLAPLPVVDELRALLDDPAISGMRESVVTLLSIAESDLGHVAAADELLEHAMDRARSARSVNLEPLQWAYCEVAWSAGRLDDCLDAAQQLVDTGSPINFGAPSTAVLLRWAMWERGQDCTNTPGPLAVFGVQRGLVDEARGIALLSTPGKEREAADAFLAAASLHDAYLRRNALRCRWAAGEALRRAGETGRSTCLLTEVRTSCEHHGFVQLQRRVDASLRLLGAAPVPVRSNGALTSREREVLALVRQGLSTSEIAARLHLRPSTIDSHIRKSMKRLRANNRREAALLADAGQ